MKLYFKSCYMQARRYTGMKLKEGLTVTYKQPNL